MKIHSLTILMIFFLEMGCQTKFVKSNLDLLSGYWRIDFITQKNETFRPRGMTKLLDYYALEKNNGVRKKVKPLINNNFQITNDQNPFTIVYDGKDYSIQFETQWDQWSEKIIKLDKSELVLEHQEKRYHYVRYIKNF